MGYALIVAFALILATTLLLHRFVAPPGARTVILFDGRRARVKRGNVSAQTLRFVEDVLRQTAVQRASVGLMPNGSLWLSPSIPVSAHQQLRNLLIP